MEVLAVPMNTYDKDAEDPSRKLARVSKPETGSLTFGGHHPPNLDTPYEISVKDKMFYYAITVMKVSASLNSSFNYSCLNFSIISFNIFIEFF